ncbi:MAG: hypothetical protein ACM31C_02945 [Acidobacteriota bacterium]
MRIPPSVIVMSLLCAVPFGLAIRDAHRAKHATAHDDYDDLDELDSSRGRAERDREEAMREMEEQTRQATEKRERARLATKLVGSDPASLGSLFDGVQLGAPAGSFQPDSVRSEIASHSDVVSVDWDVGQSRLDGVTATLLGDDCEPLVEAIGAWGTGRDGRWENPASHQRAEFDRVACSVHFERYVDTEAWIDRKDTAIVPLGAIGQPAQKLYDRVQPLLSGDLDTDDSFSWRDLGLAGAIGDTTLTAYKKNGKVIGLNVIFHTDGAGIDALEVRLTKLLGTRPTQPAADDDLGAVTWKGRVPVTLTTGDVSSLTIGTLPE